MELTVISFTQTKNLPVNTMQMISKSFFYTRCVVRLRFQSCLFLKSIDIKKVDLYLEGSDQHRGWFQTSLLESCAIYDESPGKSAFTHGFVIDENGKKMSKSLGNVISPKDIISKYGAEYT